jgi:hypothetical protein
MYNVDLDSQLWKWSTGRELSVGRRDKVGKDQQFVQQVSAPKKRATTWGRDRKGYNTGASTLVPGIDEVVKSGW